MSDADETYPGNSTVNVGQPISSMYQSDWNFRFVGANVERGQVCPKNSIACNLSMMRFSENVPPILLISLVQS